MDTTAQALLIIVSAVLIVFLVLLGILVLYTLSVVRRVRQIMERAEHVAGSMESAAAAFEKTATPLAVLKLVSNIVTHAQRRKKE